MEGYKPSNEEMQKAESMVLPSQRKIDDLRAEREKIVSELGMEIPADFSFRKLTNLDDKAPTIIYTVTGTFGGTFLTIDKEEPLHDDKVPTRYTGLYGEVPLPPDKVEAMFEKLQPLGAVDNKYLTALRDAKRNMEKDVKEEISNEAKAKIDQLGKLFGI